MKKLQQILAMLLLALATSFALTACSDDDGPSQGGGQGGNENEPTPEPTEGIDCVSSYYGDYYENGTGNFVLNFITSGMTWDEDDYTYYGPGTVITFELNSALCENPDLAAIAPGEYTFDSDMENPEMTFGFGTITDYDAQGNGTEYDIEGGTLKVEALSNGMYALTASFEIGQDKPYEFTYTGNIRPINQSGEGYNSNLTENVEIASLTQGGVIFWGETFTETSDYCSVILAGDDYDIETNFGKSQALNLGLNITPGSETIPEGTYTIINAMEADDYDAFTALSGVYEPSYGGYFGCWYFHDYIESAMYTGTITVANAADGGYTITVDMADGYGHTVKGTYTGSLRVAAE